LAFFRLFRVLSILAIFCHLTGCALVAAYPMTAAGLATTAATGKGPTDHAISESVDKDCSVWKIFDGQPICERRLKPHEIPVQDYSRRQKLVPAN
jgi:hypothetical protein